MSDEELRETEERVHKTMATHGVPGHPELYPEVQESLADSPRFLQDTQQLRSELAYHVSLRPAD